MLDMAKTTFNENDDTLLFDDEETSNENIHNANYWKVMIVDDDIQVHNITKMVLNDFIFEGKKLYFISAYSGKEAKSLINQHPDTALILLDVVMETDQAGLDFAKYIRKDLKNSTVRIVLRTGQPGQAPEQKVILDYDINDYKEKTELTSQKLFTTVISALRAYRDIVTIQFNKNGLEKIITSSSELFNIRSMTEFRFKTLELLHSIFDLDPNINSYNLSGFIAIKKFESFYIKAAIGKYTKFIDKKYTDAVNIDILKLFKNSKKNIICSNDSFVKYFKSKTGSESIVYFDGIKNFNEPDKYLINILLSNISAALNNLYLNKEIVNTQKEIIYKLGEIAEVRSLETGNHVRRVAEYCKLLALKYGLDKNEATLIKLAAPMHDIGKLGIPDKILNKPAKLTTDEFNIIKTHTTIGYKMLRHSNRDILKCASIIALEHHEKYDGTGYPQGIKGENIHIYGRITAIADVFDALSNERVYKKAWELDKILELFKQEKGKHFDPVLIDLFFKNLDEILKIKNTIKDI